jgi:DNA repair exonuclease SbcCD ATPase subunit
MGWPSLIEDIVKRFDAEKLWSFPSPQFGKAPSAKAIAERERLDREERATTIAIRLFQQNERKLKKLKAENARLEQQLSQANRVLQKWKNRLAEAAKANNQLNNRLGSYRAKFAHRILPQRANAETQNASSVSSLMEKIEQIKEKSLATLDKEVQERFNAIADYALSEKKLSEQEIETAILNQKLAEAKQEIDSLRSFYGQVEKRSRALDAEAKSYEGWEIMDEWLKNNSIISPKEENDRSVPKKTKKAQAPVFNPVLKGSLRF